MVSEIGKATILLGVILVILGFLLNMMPNWRLGKLPGDIFIQRHNVSIYIPIVTSVVLSVVLSLLLWVVTSLRR